MIDLNLPPTQCRIPEPTGDTETDAAAMLAYVDCRLREGMAIISERYQVAQFNLTMYGYPHDPANPKTTAEIHAEMEAAVTEGRPFPPGRYHP